MLPTVVAATRSPPVTMRAISKRYGSTVALENIDLDVEAGEFITLLGASGSGKTTLLMILAGFVRPDSGSIRVGDEEIIATPPHKRNVGMVFQNYALFPHMNVFENIGFPLRQRRIPRGETIERVRRVLDLVQLGGLGERRVDQLSGGQRQRVALARAIVFEPRILLMDEPLSALDKQLREQMQIEIRHLHERLGMTTVYVTHDQREALTLSDRVAVIATGSVTQLDTPRRLYERPRSRNVAEFIGESSFLPVELNGSQVRGPSGPLVLSEAPTSSAARQWLVLRPEKLWLADESCDAASVNIFEGRVTDIVYQGESFVCYVELEAGHRLAIRSYSRVEALARMPEVGQPIRLGLNPADTIIVPEDL